MYWDDLIRLRKGLLKFSFKDGDKRYTGCRRGCEGLSGGPIQSTLFKTDKARAEADAGLVRADDQGYPRAFSKAESGTVGGPTRGRQACCARNGPLHLLLLLNLLGMFLFQGTYGPFLPASTFTRDPCSAGHAYDGQHDHARGQ